MKSILSTLLCIVLSWTSAMADPAQRYLDAVSQFADNVLTHGRDVYGPKHTPQFIDGLNIDTRKPATWKQTDGREWVISNLGNQQNLFRALDGLSALTGDPKYKAAAQKALKHAFDDLSWGGLLPWGGHMAYDATTDAAVWAEDSGKVHELKCHYPHYALMWETDPVKTRALIEHTWNGHVYDWATLDFNRHGRPRPLGALWDHEFRGGKVFFWGRGLTFLNAGTDLFYAAAMLSHSAKDPKPLVWAKRLAGRYDATRNPKTGISGVQFSQTKAFCDGPRIRGDRAQYQFGEAFKGHHVVEGTLFMRPKTREQICQLLMGDLLGEKGRIFTRYARTEITAWGKVAYRKSDNAFIPMLTDGTSLEGFAVPKPGYFGPKGRVIKATPASPREFRLYALGYRIARDPFLWDMARSIATGLKMGHIGASAKDRPRLTLDNLGADPATLFALLECHRATRRQAFLDAACRVGDGMLTSRFHKGFFVRSPDHVMARFDAAEPVALLHLVAALRGKPRAVPVYMGGSGFYAAAYAKLGHKYDVNFLYGRTRK